jgi:protein TonB
MRVKLPESARDRKRSFGGAAVSTLLHGLLIGGSVVATGITAEHAATPEQPERLVYIVPERTPSRQSPAAEPPRQLIPTNVEPLIPALDPPRIDLAIVPAQLPLATSTIGTVGADAFRTLRRDSVPTGPHAVSSNEAFTEMTVEKAAQPRAGNPAPRYPSLLVNAGVEGVVYARFVVDTTGRVEAESIRFTKSDHLLFERAVRESLLRSRFVPAEAGARRVRQLVEQAFSFAITDRK